MQYLQKLYKETKWYVAHEILSLEPDQPLEDERLEVWENLILIRANGPEEAYLKAIAHGYANESEILIGGNKGKVRFKGLRQLFLVYDELEDGAELEWHGMELTQEQIDGILKRKEDLHAFNPVTVEDEE